MSAPARAATLPGIRAAIAGRRLRIRSHHLALGAVLALATVLDVHRISQNGYGNIFYSAGVKSMLRSLHNFFFVSSDPGGLIMVDKPPLGLWLQAVSVKLFGFSSSALLLPEAVIGVLAVALLYRMLARRIGGWPAVAGALALAVFPSFVAISRTNNVDGLLILLMILACDAGLRAIETGRRRTLLWSAVLVGLAFNTKTLAAYLVVPGIALGYLLCAGASLRTRLVQLLAAGVVMVAVSAAWMAVVELTPASQRPYVGSSTDNSELGLTFNYNGFGRVGGQTGGPGKIPAGAGGLARKAAPTTPGTGKPGAGNPGAGKTDAIHTTRSTARRPTFLPNGRERTPIPFGGPIGPLRLFGKGLNTQGAWMLPFALAGLLAFALLVLGRGRGRERATIGQGGQNEQSGQKIVQQGRGSDRSRLGLLIVLGGWLLTEAAVLSLSKGIVHPYYVSALGPGLAAMVGAGTYAFGELARRRDWRLLLLPCAAAATVPVQLSMLHKDHYMSWLTAPLIAVVLVGLLALLLRRTALPAIALVLGALLIAPAVYSASNWLAPVQSTFPAAGPRAAAGPGGYGVNAEHVDVDRALLRYVASHGQGTRWSVLTGAANTASPMILLGSDAGSLAGFSGIDPAVDGRSLARLVARGQARYVILGGEFSTRGGNGATAAVQRACRVVATRRWLPRPLTPNGLILFDCGGLARTLASA